MDYYCSVRDSHCDRNIDSIQLRDLKRSPFHDAIPLLGMKNRVVSLYFAAEAELVIEAALNSGLWELGNGGASRVRHYCWFSVSVWRPFGNISKWPRLLWRHGRKTRGRRRPLCGLETNPRCLREASPPTRWHLDSVFRVFGDNLPWLPPKTFRLAD